MSRIEVDKIQQQCGTTLTVGGGACKTAVVDATTVTLGRCGGTVSLASGATQSGFGRTGTVDWITTPKVTGDSPITAVTGKGYFLNTTAGTITINLPAGSAGDIISIADYTGTFATYNVTVAPNGSQKIAGIAGDATLDVNGQSVTFIYVDAVEGWVNTMDSTANIGGATYITATVSGSCNAITTVGDYKIAMFKNPGTFCISTGSGPAAKVDYAIIGGGGGGGNSNGGGGGAGGMRYGNGPGCTQMPLSPGPYPVVIGGGGAGQPGPQPSACGQGASGAVSSFNSFVGAGGGGAGSGAGPNPTANGLPGGSGGGGGTNSGLLGNGNQPPTTPSQGNPGGNGGGPGPLGVPYQSGAGGGGHAAPGASAAPTPVSGGAGGAGTDISPVFGTAPQPFYMVNGPANGASACGQFAGGGGGGVTSPTTAGGGGVGGGGNGTNVGSCGANGTANTGGGAGGGGNDPGPPGAGGTGGSGIVLIRYKFQ
jgi:hypothetical protein